jgi:N-acetylmuramoyl-L-alanine amidase
MLRAALAAALAVASSLLLVLLLVEFSPEVATFITKGNPFDAPTTKGTQIALPGLESGACMSYPAANGRASKTVFIDPGHGGIDPGVVTSVGGRPTFEKEATLAVANRLSTILRADGYRVVMARTRDSSVVKLSPDDTADGAMKSSAAHRDLLARAACANAAQASVLLSIHFDAFSDPSVGGSETFYDAARTFAAENKRLATTLQSALVTGLGTSDRGAWSDDKLNAPTLTSEGRDYGYLIELGPKAVGWVDNPSQMPGALVEPLFLTNPAEAQMAIDRAGQERIAQALAAGLEKYLRGA